MNANPPFDQNWQSTNSVEDKKLSILLLDDSEFERTRFERMLGQMPIDCNIVLAEGVVDYWNALNKQRYDFIFIDYVLQDACGLNALRYLRSHPVNEKAVAVLISDSSDPNLETAAEAHGFNVFIRKDDLSRKNLQSILQPEPEAPATEQQRKRLLNKTYGQSEEEISAAIRRQNTLVEPVFRELTLRVRQVASHKLDEGQYRLADLLELRKSCADFVSILSQSEPINREPVLPRLKA